MQALLLTRNILLCLPGDGRRAGSEAEQGAHPALGMSICMPARTALGQVLASAPPGRNSFSAGMSGGLVFPSLEERCTVCCDPHKGSGVVYKAEVDVFLELLLFERDAGNWISGSSAFSKSSLNIW